MIAITRRQREIYDFINGFIHDKGHSPSFEEMRRGLSLNSLATVHKHIVNMQAKGLLHFVAHSARSIEVLPPRGSLKRDLVQENRELRQRVAALEKAS